MLQQPNQLVRAFPASGQTGQSGLGAGFSEALQMLEIRCRNQRGDGLSMSSNQDGLTALCFADASGEMGLGLGK